jgi:hypothetical protein
VRFKSLITITIPLILALSSCSLLILDPPSFIPEDRSLLVVESELYAQSGAAIDQHLDWLGQTGGAGYLELVDAAEEPEAVRAILRQYAGSVDSAFFIGEIPAVWYEQRAFGEWEYFPVDVYYMDPDSVWTDSDGDGYYDAHGALELELAVGRLQGTPDEINRYFSKLEEYRSGQSPDLAGAYIFKDNDWHYFYRSSVFGLNNIYTDITISQDDEDTSRMAYLEHLSRSGADYVYQWIHANPTALYFNAYSEYDTLAYYELDNQIQGRFMNMFNCKGVRITQPNIGMSYLTSTDLTLAITGSTKVGGNYYPMEFHRELSVGNSWGEAFIGWYNAFGVFDDEWFLGMVILGDPSLRLRQTDPQTGISRSAIQSIMPPLREQRDELGSMLMEFDQSLEGPDSP